MRKAIPNYTPKRRSSLSGHGLKLSRPNTERLRVNRPGARRRSERWAAPGRTYTTVEPLAVDMLGRTWVVAPQSYVFAEWGFKRAMDIVLAAALLAVTLPLMTLVALLIKCTSRGDVIFRQSRVGRDGGEFTMYKFRTMHPNAASEEERLAQLNRDRVFLKIEDDDRVTPVGRVLRKYSLDELPQLINVLRGDMSLVGPRPLLPSDMQKFPRGHWARRFTVPPGLTGLWQISGRSLCTDQERIRLDLEYVERWSIWLDLWILAHTPAAVLLARGAH